MSFAVVVVGPAGSGKSTVARELARRATAVYLDKDALAGPLVEAALAASGNESSDREGNDYYRTQLMPAEYASLFAVAGDNLRLGHPVVIDAPFAAYLDSPGFFTRSATQARWPNTRTFVLRVLAPEAIVKARLSERGLARDAVKLSDWDTFWTTWGTTPVTWTGVRVLDVLNDGAGADIDAVLERIHEGEAPNRQPQRGSASGSTI
jgi:predicted kinase